MINSHLVKPNPRYPNSNFDPSIAQPQTGRSSRNPLPQRLPISPAPTLLSSILYNTISSPISNAASSSSPNPPPPSTPTQSTCSFPPSIHLSGPVPCHHSPTTHPSPALQPYTLCLRAVSNGLLLRRIGKARASLRDGSSSKETRDLEDES